MKPKPLTDYSPPMGPLDIVHKDKSLLVVNKPSGLLSVPGSRPENYDCLEHRVKDRFKQALLVHRLDMDTSGLMLFAMNKVAQRHINWQFERRQIAKTYMAEVEGHVGGRSGFINMPLIVDWPQRPLQKVCFETGKPSLTYWEVAERRTDSTLLTLYPKTGRSHQLRVHCLEMGHTIIGDRFYQGRPADRLKLHAQSVTLMHPWGGAHVTYSVPAEF